MPVYAEVSRDPESVNVDIANMPVYAEVSRDPESVYVNMTCQQGNYQVIRAFSPPAKCIQ